MKEEKIVKTSQEQAEAAWIGYLHESRIASIIMALAKQDGQLESSLLELQIINDFISDPAHILGNPDSKHGEIAEHFQVHLSNALRMISGDSPEYTFETVERLAPEDYLKNGLPVQSKFYHDYAKTFRAVCNHLKAYPDFLKKGGTYDIPKNQFARIIDVLSRGENERFSLARSDETLFKNIREWEESNNVKFQDVVKPAIVNYEDVQLYEAPNTLRAKQQSILKKDKEIRDDIYQQNRSSLKEATKVVGVSALLEGGTAFMFRVIEKRREGKIISDFSTDDWKDVGIDTATGTIKGGIRGSAVYYLVNQKGFSAPISNAAITATFGIIGEIIKLRQGKTAFNDFYDNSLSICSDVAISTVSSTIGTAIIPIPILGTIIGNAAGMWVWRIAKDYLSQTEFQSIKRYNSELELLQQNIDADYQKHLEKVEARIGEYKLILTEAYSDDPMVAYQSAEKAAYHLGITDSIAEYSKEERDKYFLE